MQKVALAVMRLQPLHRGHELVIETMLARADRVIVAIGSIQAQDGRNPYSFAKRKEMVRALYGDRVEVVGLSDIGAPTPRIWAEYVLSQIAQEGLPTPTAYYCGAEDAFWFEGVLPVYSIDRQAAGEGISATQIRADLQAGRSVADRLSAAVLALIKE